MKKVFNLLAGIGLLAGLYYAYKIPASMIKAEIVTPVVSVVPTGKPSEVPTGTAEALSTGSLVTVVYSSVNLRNRDLTSTGKVVLLGDSLSVYWLADGWGRVLDGQFAGLYIWRGCTSDPASRKCLMR